MPHRKKGAVRRYQVIAFQQNALLIVRVDFALDPAVGKHYFVGGVGLQINLRTNHRAPEGQKSLRIEFIFIGIQ